MNENTHPELRRRLPDQIDIAELERSALGMGGEDENFSVMSSLSELRRCPQCGEEFAGYQIDIQSSEVASSRFGPDVEPAILLRYRHKESMCDISITNGENALDIEGETVQ